ncbi:TRAP transporter small permease subunit [Reichenbachiella sp.]|uniref:TRAP transporter small permease subunit n=1 Tax=Reichenbachiella sp. TaxID=2184521 RepID=UPI0032975017
MNKTIHLIRQSAESIAGVLLILCTSIGAYNAIVRYAGKHLSLALASNTLIEVQWYLFSLIFLIGGVSTFIGNEHIRIDILYEKWSIKRKLIVNIIGNAIFFVPFFSVITILSYDYFSRSWSILEASPDPGGLPRYLVKGFMPMVFFLFLIVGVLTLINQISELIKTKKQ